ncbi:uncharacterized protein LOC121389866 [Gigantopelta aegis]|uniref:uncharacterized protein LOC121389866 n=1 Tax=Gigantopelta aegis TaxID=1735272 RepID=UPI001B88D3F7|nr:uncharacterized protein LOC121389866 [Gigantopelta aegis]
MWRNILVWLAFGCVVQCTILRQLPDGFEILELGPNSTVHFGVVPNMQYEEIGLTFNKVNISANGCDNIVVYVEGDGYIKGMMPLARLCSANDLASYTETSPTGFYVIVQTFSDFTWGEIHVHFPSLGGITVTNEVLSG